MTQLIENYQKKVRKALIYDSDFDEKSSIAGKSPIDSKCYKIRIDPVQVPKEMTGYEERADITMDGRANQDFRLRSKQSTLPRTCFDRDENLTKTEIVVNDSRKIFRS